MAVLLMVLAVVMPLAAGCADSKPVTIRVLTYNIHHGAGMDKQIDLPRIAKIIRDSGADLVALEEVDRNVPRTSHVDQPAVLGELTGMHAVFEKNADMQGGDYGNAVLSRYPITRYENHLLPNFPGNEQRGCLEVHVRIAGKPAVFFAAHLDHQQPDGERRASIAAIRKYVAANPDATVILAGDLNAEPDSAVLADAEAFLANADQAAESNLLTYPADQPDRKIDYVLYRDQPGLRCVSCRVIPEAVASDHRPLLAELRLDSVP
ncbi:MAG: endonuclease/exonuclease/phosphatase family protein [Phycisphaerales bacterium]|nr:endonuclease/exonuclease/phosphatase family protein [Phycisphaerales bacterium]